MQHEDSDDFFLDEPTSEEPLAATRKLARGMRAARRLEASLERLRLAELRVKHEAKPGTERKKLLRQLSKLAECLEDLERTAISHGMGKRAFASLDAHLEPIDERLAQLREKKLSDSRLDKSRLLLRTHRQALQR